MIELPTRQQLRRELSHLWLLIRGGAARHTKLAVGLALAAFAVVALLFALLAANAAPSDLAETPAAGGKATSAERTLAAPPTPTTRAPASPPPMTTHVVSRGETLAKIALRYQTPYELIAERNSLADPNRIIAGQKLAIPLTPVGVLVVQPGQTLSGYAQLFGMTVDELAALNPQITDRDHIRAGGQLRVRSW